MGRKLQKKKGKQRNNRTTMRREGLLTPSSWVDRIAFASCSSSGDSDDSDEEKGEDSAAAQGVWQTSASIVSWNVLAHSYCSRTSQRNLPLPYQKLVFHERKRKQKIVDILTRLVSEETDVLCLQEVDMDEVGDALRKKLGWEGIETPRQKNGGGSGSRVDSCAVFVDPEHWRIHDHTVIKFDELASLIVSNGDADDSSSGDEKGQNHVSINLGSKNLQGLKQSFLRRNVGAFTARRDWSNLCGGKYTFILESKL